MLSCLAGDKLPRMENEDEHFTTDSGLGPLRVWHDAGARSAAMNMAIDEVLVQQMNGSESSEPKPILRYYDWARPSVSIGYFQRWQETVTQADLEEVDLMRRWTGGGRVDHREDHTYTLVLPREHPLFLLSPAENYKWIHRCVVRALEQIGATATVTDSANSFSPRGEGSPNCFDCPVQFDVVNDEGGKLAGAAQRRTRWGLLHQGSVVEAGLAEHRQDWEKSLAEILSGNSGELMTWQAPATWLERAEQLAEEKYARQTWLEKF